MDQHMSTSPSPTRSPATSPATTGRRHFGLRTTDGREFDVHAHADDLRRGDAQPRRAVRRRDRPDARHARARALPVRLRHLLPEGGDHRFEAKHIVFVGRQPTTTCSSSPDWWINQIRALADFYLQAQFPDGEIDYRKYRTTLTLDGRQASTRTRQETDTISRLVYGFATAYLLTGEDRFLEAAEKGTEYLRDHMRAVDATARAIVYWYHGIDVSGDGTRAQKVLASEFGDDYDAIPAYEQIYALAGPDADLPRHRRPADPQRHRDDASSLFDQLLPRPRGRRLLLPHRPDHLRPARRDARPQPGAQELELGRRPRARVPDQRLSRHRRASTTPTSSSIPPTRSSSASPTTSNSPFVQRAVPRGLEPRPASGAGSRTAPSSATT